MSFMTDVYVVPSRVLGVYRYVLHSSSKGVGRSELEEMLSPVAILGIDSSQTDSDDEEKLKRARAMTAQTINECVKAKLLTEKGGRLRLSAALPKELKDKKCGERLLPLALTDLLFSDRKRSANHDLGCAIAWFLSLDIYSAPITADTLEPRQWEHVQSFGLNPTRFDMLGYWACYMGYAWMQTSGRSRAFVPDPTTHVRSRMMQILGTAPKREASLPSVMKQLADRSPVFEGGYLRDEVASVMGQSDDKHLSSSTSAALLRLRDEGSLELAMKSDAERMMVHDGTTYVPYSTIVWRGGV